MRQPDHHRHKYDDDHEVASEASEQRKEPEVDRRDAFRHGINLQKKRCSKWLNTRPNDPGAQRERKRKRMTAPIKNNGIPSPQNA
jgi:hypothetical protein